MSSTVTIVQIIFICFVACLAFISGILPTKIPWCKNSINVLGIANAFSGGVFLAIAFMHIMPEVAEGYTDYLHPHEHDPDDPDGFRQYMKSGGLTHGDGDDDFPLPFALVFLGYAFILLIDKVVFDTHSLVDGHDHNNHGHDLVQENFVHNVKSSFIKFQKLLSDDMSNGNGNPNCNTKNNETVINDSIKKYLSRNDKFAVRMSVALNKTKMKKMTSRTFVNKDDGLVDDDQAHLFADSNNIDFKVSHAGEDDLSQLRSPSKKMCSCNLTPIVLMIALSTHAVFEGIAVGVEKDMSSLWTYIIAITLHKWAAAMSLGISMSKNFKEEGNTVYLLLLIFSLATPLGISIGMIVSGDSDLTDIIFSSLAGGTFVYIACSEVIVEEFSTPDYKWIKMIMFMLGAGVITSLHFLE
jgi:zinc transporter ZupT